MKIRALTLTNVRKFGGKSASITQIGDGVTVVSEANEFGKSTFFDALHALFFVKYGASSKEVKSLQPRSGGAVRISAEVELDAGSYLIEKSFIAQKRAIVTDLQTQLIVAQDDEAEAWITALMDNGLEGPAGLLWVRQGVTALEPSSNVGADKTEKEKLLNSRRDLLSSVAGEIDLMTGGRRMDRVLERCKLDFGKLATASGKPKANGPWKAEETLVQDLERKHAELDEKCSELSGALEERRRLERELAGWEDPTARDDRQKALKMATNAHATATEYIAKCSGAELELSLKKLEYKTAVEALNKILMAEQGLIEARNSEQGAREAEKKASIAEATAREQEVAARKALESATDEVAKIRERIDSARQAETARNSREKLKNLEQQIERAEEKRKNLETANGMINSIAATKSNVAEADRLLAEVRRFRDARDAAALTVTMQYEGDLRVNIDGVDLAEGVSNPISVRSDIAMPGIGRLVIDPGVRSEAGTVDLALEAARNEFRDILSDCGVETIETAHKALHKRQEAEEQARLAKGLLDGIAPDGIEALRAELSKAKVLAETVKSAAEPSDSVEVLEVSLPDALHAEQGAKTRFEELRENHATKRSEVASCKTALALAETALNAAEDAAGSATDRKRLKDEAGSNAAKHESALADASNAYEEMQANAPDIATAAADLSRAKGAVEQANDSIAKTRNKIGELSASIRTRAEDGIEEALAETAGRLEEARAREARYAAEVAALDLLQSVLEETRTEAHEAYFGPIQEELKPLISILHSDAAIGFDTDRMLPGSLSRGGEEEDMDVLSGGTQEQIAILTRLAFARLFARQGRPIPIILDDALVYSDDDRIVKMFTALHRVAAEQQILVFTCRQMAFAKLGGARPDISVEAVA